MYNLSNNMYSIVKFSVLSLMLAGASGFSFQSVSKPVRLEADQELDLSSSESSRRLFLEQVTKGATSMAIAPALITVAPQPVLASGGATAGGAYLLSVSCGGCAVEVIREAKWNLLWA